jgi:hypothetical protein
LSDARPRRTRFAGTTVIDVGYFRGPNFRDIHRLRIELKETPMTSESVAGILGGIVALVVLVMAIVYGPLGQFGKPTKPATITQPAAPTAPAPRGPVIKEVPN